MQNPSVSTCHFWSTLLQAEGVVKYNHNDSVQVLAYNPLSQQLASGTASDFGLWSPELKHVAKHKVSCLEHFCMTNCRLMPFIVLIYYTQIFLCCISSAKASLRSPPQVTSKVVSLAWTNDGQFLALGLYDGHISIRSRVGEETTIIQRDAPVWTLSWNPNRYTSSC